ncbi:putative Dolichyl-diphosphooligosaccharide--protein glycosyltransferase subunit STT3 [Blattamonas nauphoetae]|uniref:dolichyl-diphosphooligosaccharide--protein glycotransferase n=1 Tax=Blattamonas nauphoetae TaxID=2049346 RepID=A0ABQ9XE36_9EUKA|nr:putative Dolichyl-diphosphooligosaccharide--protein glycosyltransferase subunit STT3 [Blattamonas nauphoetae]
MSTSVPQEFDDTYRVHKFLQRSLKTLILLFACIVAFIIRFFSVVKYESIIHEFDPYFQYRASQYFIKNGMYDFHNWFDERTWYPIGRIVGPTVYPGLMWSAAAVYYFMEFIGFPVDVRNACMIVSPLWASFTVLITYKIVKAVWSKGAGLIAAMMIAVIPGYMSRSVAGSFDNECISIFALLLTFYFWIRSVQTGNLFYSVATALSYFYMASAWGGYVFIINLIPLYVLVMIVFGRYSDRLFAAYTTFYILGILLSMQIQFVSFMPVQSGEHLASFGMFGFCTVIEAVLFFYRLLTKEEFSRAIRVVIAVFVVVAAVALAVASYSGYITPWTGRFYNLLHPTYAKSHIPIIASVSEHQPTAWPHFFFDLHLTSIIFPAGIWFIFAKLKNQRSIVNVGTSKQALAEEAEVNAERRRNDGLFFILVYGLASLYFSGVMVRLMLVLAPVACIICAIALDKVSQNLFTVVTEQFTALKIGVMSKIAAHEEKKASSNKDKPKSLVSKEVIVSIVALATIVILLLIYGAHCLWAASTAYSSPSIVMAWYRQDGSVVMIDDFREAYSWLRHNTDVNARVMSWWDYGYQLTAVANRTVLVDNNTWNNSHIATVGTAMSSTEEDAYPILRMLDVDYILVVFGGMSGFSGDDINKFLWMVRIGGGVFPRIKEKDYLSKRGEYRVDREAGPAFLTSLMYSMCYYDFGKIQTMSQRPAGFDVLRGVEIGRKDISFKHLEEAYTSDRWIIRIYKVKKDESF